jgi:hypothetical protein
MNARTEPSNLHPVFAELLAPFAPQVQRYDVTLTFTDGVYRREAYAGSPERAIELGLIDARMASPFSSHCGALIESQAYLVPP